MTSSRPGCASWYVLGILLATGAGVRLAPAHVWTHHWSNLFPGDGAVDEAVEGAAAFNEELRFCGRFTSSMGRTVYYVARWDGRRWARVGAGLGVEDPSNELPPG